MPRERSGSAGRWIARGTMALGVASVGALFARSPAGSSLLPPRSESALLERMATDWRGAPVLSGQRKPVCDTVVVGLPVARCGAVTPLSPELLDRYAAMSAAFARRSAGADRDEPTLRGLARIDVAVSGGDPRTLTRAATMLEDVALRPDATIDLLVDHSALRLQRYAVVHEVRDLVLGIESASRALVRDPSRADAAWNRALGLTWASMRTGATTAWAQYDTLARRQHRSGRPVLRDDAPLLTEGAVALGARWPEASREFAWSVALPRLSRAVVSGRPDSVSAAVRLVDSLSMLATRTGVDGDIGGVRDALLEAFNRHDTAGVALLHNALLRFSWARSTAGRQAAAAASAVVDSLADSDALPASLRRWVLLEQANQWLVLGRTPRALSHYRSLIAGAPSSGTLFGVRAATGEAMALGSLGRTAESVAAFVRVEATCVRLGLDDCRLGSAAMAALYASLLGDVDMTEEAASRALRAQSSAPFSQWYWSTAYLMRQVSELHGATLAADAFDREAIAAAARLGRSDLATMVMIERTSSAVERHDSAAAVALMHELRATWVPRQSGEDQASSRADLLAFDAALQRRSEPQRSLALIDSALQLREGNENDAVQSPLLLSRALARLAAGDTMPALDELHTLLQRLRARGRTRETVFDAARMARIIQGIAQTSADVLRARGDAAGALRALTGMPFRGAAGAGCCGTDVSSTIAVRLSRDSIWIWNATAEGWRLKVAPLAPATVRAAIALDTAGLESLHDVIFGGRRVPAALCIDARGPLAQVPWSALRDRARGRFLAEQSRIRLVSDALRGCPADVASRYADRVVLVDAAADTGRRALPAAKREVAALRTLWGTTALVDGRGVQATLQAMSEATMVHFAGHAVLDRSRPDRSYLLVGTGRDSMVTGTSIAGARFRRAPLVILGACDAAGGTTGAFGGFDSLAGAFLGAGASQVIAAAWPVDDAPTAALMLELHAALRAGLGAAAALQRAQVKALSSRDPALRSPRVWAAFQVMGSE